MFHGVLEKYTDERKDLYMGFAWIEKYVWFVSLGMTLESCAEMSNKMANMGEMRDVCLEKTKHDGESFPPETRSSIGFLKSLTGQLRPILRASVIPRTRFHMF